MSCPVRCYSCGRDLAAIYPNFKTLVDLHVKKYISLVEVHPENLDMTEGQMPSIEYILNILGLNLICCRTFITQFTDEVAAAYRGLDPSSKEGPEEATASKMPSKAPLKPAKEA